MTPTTMQIIAGQNVKANSKPAPTGFGFGSGHNPTAAAKMMVRSGAAPMTSKTSPTLTHIDLRYSRMDKCGLTVKLSGRATVPDQRRGRTPFSSAGGAQPQAHHGPPPMIVRTQMRSYQDRCPTQAMTPSRKHKQLRTTQSFALRGNGNRCCNGAVTDRNNRCGARAEEKRPNAPPKSQRVM